MPALLLDGHPAEAHAQLTDVGGCRTDVASWTVTAWALALGTDPGPEPAPEEPPAAGGDVPVEEPGAPTSIHLAVWPDDTPSVAIVTLEGAFVLIDARQPARGCWRRVATPRTPLSRDIALAVDAKSAEVVWSDRDGVHARALRRGGVARPGSAGALPGGPPSRLGEVRCLATPPVGEQARYPLTALIISPGELEVVWSADRRGLLNAQARAWAPPAAGPPLPPACTGAERLACLDVAAETDRTAWLLCLTDHGRMLAARWDTALGSYEEWIQLESPARNIAALTVVCLQGRPMAIAVTADGSLLCLDARAAVDGDEPWHSIDRPDALRRSADARALSAGSAGADGWLALASGDGAWVVPIDRQGSAVRCGPARSLWLGN